MYFVLFYLILLLAVLALTMTLIDGCTNGWTTREQLERYINKRTNELQEFITDKDITYRARIEELNHLLKHF